MDRGTNNKHNYKSVRDYIIDKVAKDIHEKHFKDKAYKEVKDLVEQIHNFQFSDALEATKSFTEIEFAGIGTYKMSVKAMKKKVIELEKVIPFMEEFKKKPEDIEDAKEDLEYLKTKLKYHYEFQDKASETDHRRLAKLSGSSKRHKGADRDSLPGADGNMQDL